jgi:hypothetical protein
MQPQSLVNSQTWQSGLALGFVTSLQTLKKRNEEG